MPINFSAFPRGELEAELHRPELSAHLDYKATLPAFLLRHELRNPIAGAEVTYQGAHDIPYRPPQPAEFNKQTQRID